MANEQQDRGPVEASRTPVETALCAACGKDEDAPCDCGPERHRGFGVVRLHTGVVNCMYGHPFVPPPPEAVEPPLTDERCQFTTDNRIMCGQPEDSPLHDERKWPSHRFKPVESSQEGSETPYLGHSFIRAANGGPICCACAKPEAEHGPYQQQEGSETGGEWPAEVTDEKGRAWFMLGAALMVAGRDGWTPGLKAKADQAAGMVERAITSDAEERARAEWAEGHDMHCDWIEAYEERGRVMQSVITAAEERATQAEGQRDYLRSVLEQIHRDGHDALSEVSPSTEATPSESTEGQQ